MYPIEVLEKNESKKLYQWDTERYVLITAPKGIEVDAVDFAHEKDLQAVRKKIVIENGTMKAKIPNALLQSNEKIRAWLMCGEQTVYSRGLVVLPKSKSPDYVLPDDEDEVRSYISLEKRIEDLEKNGSCAGATDVLQYVEQELTEEQQKQARKNISAASVDEVSKLSKDIADLKENGTGTGGTGWTNAQIDLLDEIGNYLPFTSVDGGKKWDELITSLRNGASEEPDVPEEPDNPEVTLTSISATYNGGDVTVGTSVNSLTGITVKATYSDGSTKTVTGHTLSGTITEGSNTITVSYGGKTTTFTVTGVAESGGDTSDELITAGLLDFFDFRNCEYNNDGAGGSTIIQPTQGNGQLYTWAKNMVTDRNEAYGITTPRAFMYATNKSTTQASLGTAFTWVFKSRYNGSGLSNPFGSNDYMNADNLNKIEYHPQYYKTDGTTTKIAKEVLGTRCKDGYELLILVVDGNICKLYFNNVLMKEVDGGTLDGFTSWYDKLSCKLLNGDDYCYATQLAVYNRALSEVEITEMQSYLQSLEVA